tara:strand:- start:44 stop:598 length:555 start_codon:yes stop_codon:yes gene_type:complete
MGLKQDLLDAITQAHVDTNPGGDSSNLPDTSDGTYIERLAHYQTEAIANFITQCEFTITQLKAPVIVEKMKTPEQAVNIELETLLGEYQPVLKMLKQLGNPLGLGPAIDELEGEIEKAITPLLEGGAKLVGLDLGKDDGGLESTGYVFIGEDPDSQDEFDVEDENGQREFTTVKVFRDDIEDLL